MYIVKVYNSFILLRKKLMPYISVFNVLIFFFFPSPYKNSPFRKHGSFVLLYLVQASNFTYTYIKKKKKETTTRALDRILQPAYN